MILIARQGALVVKRQRVLRRDRRILCPSPHLWFRRSLEEMVFHVGMHRFAIPVVPGSSTFDTGSANFTVPSYSTLVVEVWGAGGGGNGASTTSHIGGLNPGSDGGNSSVVVNADTLLANGGGCFSAGGNQGTPALAATASGGTTNTSGGVGGTGVSDSYPSAAVSGLGAGAPNGGGNAASANSTTTNGVVHGTTGTTPGGGASGDAGYNSAIPRARGYCGSNSGAYCTTTYTLGVGQAPAIGASLAYVVGAKGIGSNLDGAAKDGAQGRVKFTWS